LNRRGFTMVEVIIVVAVIAVLASIIMPKMTGARQKSALEACKQNLLKLGIAMELYANENSGKCVPSNVWYYPNYLVTAGCLKAVPLCPLGNSYYIHGLYPTACRDHFPGGYPLVICYTTASGGVRHPGLGDNCPYYWPGGGAWDR